MNKLIKNLLTVMTAVVLVLSSANITEVSAETKAPAATAEKIDTAVGNANAAIEKLDGIVVTKDNLETVKTDIAKANDLIKEALKLDGAVVFDTYPIDKAQKEVDKLEKPSNEDKDKAAEEANEAIANLPTVESVTFENLLEVLEKVANARQLVKDSKAIDETIVYDMYQITQLEERVQEVLAEVDAAVDAAQKAIDSLPERNMVTYENHLEVLAQVATAEKLIADANELDGNVTFNTFKITEIKAEVVLILKNVDAKAKEVQDAIDNLENFKFVAQNNFLEVEIAIANVNAKINAFKNIDANVVFDTYPLEELEEKVVAYEKLVAIDEAVLKAQKALNELPKYVTPETLDEVSADLSYALELVAKAHRLDENVTFDMYNANQLAMRIATLREQMDIDEAAAKANEALEALPKFVTTETLDEAIKALANAKELVAFAHELDENIVFDMYNADQLEERIAVLEQQMIIDKAVMKAHDAIEALPKPEEVTAENMEEIVAQVEYVKSLIEKAEALDEFVVFNKYPIKQLEERFAELTEKEIPLTPLEPSTPVKPDKSEDTVKPNKTPGTGIASGIMGSITTASAAAAALYVLRKKK